MKTDVACYCLNRGRAGCLQTMISSTVKAQVKFRAGQKQEEGNNNY